jgi:hypothetical protein
MARVPAATTKASNTADHHRDSERRQFGDGREIVVVSMSTERSIRKEEIRDGWKLCLRLHWIGVSGIR